MTSEEMQRLIVPHANEIGGPVTALRALQETNGWIDADAVESVAHVFNLSRAEVQGLVAFYADFRTVPPPTHVLAVCQAEACQAAGSRALTRTLEDRLEVRLGQMSPDRSVGLEAVYCLGLCARAPAAMIDGELVVEADQRIDRLVGELRP